MHIMKIGRRLLYFVKSVFYFFVVDGILNFLKKKSIRFPFLLFCVFPWQNTIPGQLAEQGGFTRQTNFGLKLQAN